MRKKSINLILLIFIITLIIALIIISVYLINHSSNDTEEDNNSISSQEGDSHVNLQLTNISSENNRIQTSSNNANPDLNSLNNFEDIANAENVNDITEDLTLTLNNHTYTFDNSVKASIVENSSNKSELQIKYSNYNFQILFNTDSSTTFEDLKNNSYLKNYIEKNYNISITSSLKSGTLGNLNMIICTMSDNNGQAYFVLTPLNSSEIAYAKIYNTDNSQILIDDLSNPINQISSIISNVK